MRNIGDGFPLTLQRGISEDDFRAERNTSYQPKLMTRAT